VKDRGVIDNDSGELTESEDVVGAGEDPCSNLTTCSCFYIDNHCYMQPWALGARPYSSA